MRRTISILICFSLIFVFYICSNAFAENKSSKLNIPDNIPDSIVYDGKGDSILSIEHPQGAFVLYIKGNDESRHFHVRGYDSKGDSTELFVNTSEPYEGITIDPSQETVLLEISSNGNWHIEVRSIWTCDIIDSIGTYNGKGDRIVLLDVDAKLAQIEGNSAERHFHMRTYGDRSNLMVNTSEEYSGTVMMKYNPYILEVSAVGNWSITLS